MKIDSVIIWGGGPSIEKGLFLGLKERIKNKCVFLCNHAYKYNTNTLMTFIDNPFYNSNIDTIKQFPLVIGTEKNIDIKKQPNTILIKHLESWNNPINIKNGLFANALVGYFSISLAMWLLNNNGTIYLLGYDWTKRTTNEINKGISNYPHNLDKNIPLDKRTKTHFYKDIHRGQGFTEYYEENDPNEKFKYFLTIPTIKIYNVSPNSNITCFEKITYLELFKQINTSINYNQNELRNYIKNALQGDLQ